jgi:hypothetical protein
MAEKWDKQLKDVLQFTREEFKRTGDELKTHAQRLLVEVQDPNNQAKVKEGLATLRTWAVATGKQAQEQLESAVRRVEEVVEGTFDKRAESAPPPAPSASAPPPRPSSPSAEAAAPKPSAEKKPGASKSIGRKKPAAKAASSGTKKTAAKKGGPKSIGRKKPARPAT